MRADSLPHLILDNSEDRQDCASKFSYSRTLPIEWVVANAIRLSLPVAVERRAIIRLLDPNKPLVWNGVGVELGTVELGYF